MCFPLICKFAQIVVFVSSIAVVKTNTGHKSDASTPLSTESMQIGVLQNKTAFFENGTKEETGSPFDFLYETLLDNDLNRMCSLMRKEETQQILESLGPDYTILAPSDEAFGLLPGSKLDELYNDPQIRRKFVLRHIIAERLQLNKFERNDEKEVVTIDGNPLHITSYPNGYVINGANVLKGDISTGNNKNLVHIIDKVMYPEKQSNLLELMELNPQLSQISSFLTLSGLQNELTTNNTFTFFSPNDEAFRAIPWPVTQQMLSNNTFLKLLIANHVIPGKHYSTGLPGNQLYSIGGDLLNFTSSTVQSRKLVLVNSVPIINEDLIATNGVIHVITRILLPKYLLEDCKCVVKRSKLPQFNDNSTQLSSLENQTVTTSDPLLNDSERPDLPPSNKFDHRLGSIPRKHSPNEDHFSSTPKTVTFKSFWDDIFGSSHDSDDTNATQSTTTQSTTTQSTTTQSINFNANDSQVVNKENETNTELGIESSQTRATTARKATQTPFIWDPFSSETHPTTQSFTFRPISSFSSSSEPNSDNQSLAANQTTESAPHLKTSNQSERWTPFTPGVEYVEELHRTTTPINWISSQFASSTWPSIRTRPFYRPNITENAFNRDFNPFVTTSTYSNLRSTQKPYFRPSSKSEVQTTPINEINGTTSVSYKRESSPTTSTPTTAPTAHNQYERRSQYKPFTVEEPIEQLSEELIESNLSKHKINDSKTRKPETHETMMRRGSDPYSVPQQYLKPHEKPFDSKTRLLSEPHSQSQLRPAYGSNETHAMPEYESIRTHSPQSSHSQHIYPKEVLKEDYDRNVQTRTDESPITQQNIFNRSDPQQSYPYRTHPRETQRPQMTPYYKVNDFQMVPDYESMRTYPQKTSIPDQRPYSSPSQEDQSTSSLYNPHSPESQRHHSRPYLKQDFPQRVATVIRHRPQEPHIRAGDSTSSPSNDSHSREFFNRKTRPNFVQNYTEPQLQPQLQPQPHSDSLNRYSQPQLSVDRSERPYTSYERQPIPSTHSIKNQQFRQRQDTPHSSKGSQYPYDREQYSSERPIHRPLHKPLEKYYNPNFEQQTRSDQSLKNHSLEPLLRPEDDKRGSHSDKDLRALQPKYETQLRRRPLTRDETHKSKAINQIIESPNLMVDGKAKHFTILNHMMNSSGLYEALNKPSTYITIFMPTDEAFDALEKDSVETIKQTPSLVRKILMQHILGYSLPPQNLKNNIIIKSLNGEPHIINIIEGGKILINGIEVIAVTSAQNGIIYVIEKLLQKPEGKSRSIMDELRKRSDLSTFSSLIQPTSYGHILSTGSGPYSVFVPNNKAFHNSQPLIRQLANNQKLFGDFMRNHMKEGAIYTNEWKNHLNDSIDVNANNLTFGLNSDGKYTINNSTNLLTTDITTGNGVIHIIDSILLPDDKSKLQSKFRDQKSSKLSEKDEDREKQETRQTSLSDLSQKLGSKRFINWLTKSGLIDDMVKDGRNYTVIAPNDRAVGKLPLKIQSLLNTEPTKIKSLLEYHILPGFLDTTKLEDNDILITISGQEIRFNKFENQSLKTLSGAPIAKQAYHENVLVISVENVLYPPQGNIPSIVSKSPILKTLSQIIDKAEMEKELSERGPFTIFAPKDEAFKQLDSATIQLLQTDSNFCREFLLKHLMPKALFTTTLPISSDGSNVRTAQAMNGHTLKFQRKPNCVSVNGIILSYADITATNGVLHVVDHIL